MKRALVTGAAGFVGRHVRRELIERDYVVTAVDIVNGPGVTRGDAREFFRRQRGVLPYDLVVHAAAVIGSAQWRHDNPLLIATEDLTLDAELFAWATDNQPRHLVYLSSSAAYPTSLQTRSFHCPLNEADIDLNNVSQPDQTYGWIKLNGEQLAQRARAQGINVHVVRPQSGYGTDQSLDYPFPSLIARGMMRSNPFDVWGDGTQSRDFVHVDDFVQCILAMVELDHPGPLNIGTGRATSMLDLASLIASQCGYRPQFRTHPDMAAGCWYRVADVDAMSQVYPATIDLEEGIARALKAAT